MCHCSVGSVYLKCLAWDVALPLPASLDFCAGVLLCYVLCLSTGSMISVRLLMVPPLMTAHCGCGVMLTGGSGREMNPGTGTRTSAGRLCGAAAQLPRGLPPQRLLQSRHGLLLACPLSCRSVWAGAVLVLSRACYHAACCFKSTSGRLFQQFPCATRLTHATQGVCP